jgi:hypothetical protein
VLVQEAVGRSTPPGTTLCAKCTRPWRAST